MCKKNKKKLLISTYVCMYVLLKYIINDQSCDLGEKTVTPMGANSVNIVPSMSIMEKYISLIMTVFFYTFRPSKSNHKVSRRPMYLHP